MLDACFEIANKGVCAGLMAIYAFSPIVALIINIALFTACAFAFLWIKRREVFYRNMLCDWLMNSWKAMTGSSAQTTIADELTVFPISGVDKIPAKAKCKLTKSANNKWQLHYKPLLKPEVLLEIGGPAKLKPGWWTNSVDFGQGVQLTFSSKHNDQIQLLAEKMEFAVAKTDEVEMNTRRTVEFA